MSGLLRGQLLMRPPLPPMLALTESQTAVARKELAGQLTVGLPIPRPSPEHMQVLRAALSKMLHEGRSHDEWPLGLLRSSGWIMLDAHPTTSAHQGVTPLDDPAVLTHYLAALWKRGGVSGGRILLHSYLRLYPFEHLYLELLRITLLGLLTQGEGAVFEARRTVLQQALLAPEGPTLLAQHLLRGNPGHALASLGLTGELAQGRFVEAVWEHLAAEVSASYSPGEGFTPALRVLFALSLEGGTKLRFPHRVHDLAEALLVPWTGRGAALPVGIRNVLFQHLGDPREAGTPWEKGVSISAQAVMKQHLAGEVLADFFTLLEALAHRDTAVDRYRDQRRTLWESCYAQGALTDAWMAIGPSVRSEASRCFGARAQHYAELGTSTGARARHAVLLLRIAGTTVVEWSHSAPYYLWHPQNADAPTQYQSQYPYESLERNANSIRPHYEDQRGDWRTDFLHHLAVMSGVRLLPP